MLLVAAAAAVLPTVVFFRLPQAKRQGAYRVLPWATALATVAIFVFVAMVNTGMLSPRVANAL